MNDIVIFCFQQKGLRTLAVARRVLPEEEYIKIDRKVCATYISATVEWWGGGGRTPLIASPVLMFCRMADGKCQVTLLAG